MCKFVCVLRVRVVLTFTRSCRHCRHCRIDSTLVPVSRLHHTRMSVSFEKSGTRRIGICWCWRCCLRLRTFRGIHSNRILDFHSRIIRRRSQCRRRGSMRLRLGHRLLRSRSSID